MRTAFSYRWKVSSEAPLCISVVSKRSSSLILSTRTVTASAACVVLGAWLVPALEEADAGGLRCQQRRRSGACEGCQHPLHPCLGSDRVAARPASSYSGFGDQPVFEVDGES